MLSIDEGTMIMRSILFDACDNNRGWYSVYLFAFF